jgi:hypothetical protein
MGAVDRLGDVGDDAVAPAAHLVAEEAEAAGGADADGAFGDHATLTVVPHAGACSITNRPSGTYISSAEW